MQQRRQQQQQQQRQQQQRRRAFTLMEVALAMAIAGIVTTAALSVFALLNRRLTVVASSTKANDRAKIVVDSLVSELQQIGGASVRPFAALMVQDATGPGGATDTAAAVGPVFSNSPYDDRVLLAVTLPGAPECTVEDAVAGGPTTMSLTLNPACCLSLAALLDKQAVLAAGGEHRQVYIQAMAAGSAEGKRLGEFDPARGDGGIASCTADVARGPMAGADSGGAPASYIGGTLTPVRLTGFFVDPVAHELRSVVDHNEDGRFDLTEVSVVSTDVYAFEVELAFDCNRDGRLSASGGADEWIFDGNNTLPSGCSRQSLRAAQVALIAGAGVKDPEYVTTAVVPPARRETRSNTHLRSAIGRAVFRNALVVAF